MRRLILAALGAVLATGVWANECPTGCYCDMSGASVCSLPLGVGITNIVTCAGNSYLCLDATKHYCDPGWTLVPVATSSGTKQMCAPVGELKESK